jgi:alkylhydroperoxidase family enzyme
MVKDDYTKADLDPKTRLLMEFAVQVTRDVHQTDRKSIDELRVAGWTDEEILTATHIIGFFNYYTRMVDALGVEPEDFMEKKPGS